MITTKNVSEPSLEQKMFDRAVSLIMNEWGKSKEEVIKWLSDDTDGCWQKDE